MRQHHLRTVTKTPQVAQSNIEIKLAGTTQWFQLLIDIKYTFRFKEIYGPGTIITGTGNNNNTTTTP